jgi:hypothetical protein
VPRGYATELVLWLTQQNSASINAMSAEMTRLPVYCDSLKDSFLELREKLDDRRGDIPQRKHDLQRVGTLARCGAARVYVLGSARRSGVCS